MTVFFQVFPLGWQARGVMRDASAAVAATPAGVFMQSAHAAIDLKHDGSLDPNVVASLQRVAQQIPMAAEGLNNFHEAIEVLVGELLDGKVSGNKVDALRDRLDKLHKAAPKSKGSARAGAAAKASGNVYIQGAALSMRKAEGEEKDKTFWPD